MIFIDTNLFLRLLLQDVPKQVKEASSIFKKASMGKIKVFTNTVVFFEIYWVLKSFYRKSEQEIEKVLRQVLSLESINLDNREVLVKTLNLFRFCNHDLEDAYNLAFALHHKAQDFITFDEKQKKHFILLKQKPNSC